MPIVETDPLCGQSHPIKLSAGQKEYYYCSVSHSTVWLTSPITRERILGNGGRVIENPSEESIAARPLTVQEERAERAGLGGAIPPAPPPADELSPIWRKLGLGLGENAHEPGFCPGCRAIIRVGQSPCPRCGTPIDWSE